MERAHSFYAYQTIESICIWKTTAAHLRLAYTEDKFVRKKEQKKLDVSTSYLYDPWAVGKCHDVTFLPEEGRIWAFDHFKLTEHLHCVHLLRGLMPNLHKHIITKNTSHTFCEANSLLTHTWTNIFKFCQILCIAPKTIPPLCEKLFCLPHRQPNFKAPSVVVL